MTPYQCLSTQKQCLPAEGFLHQPLFPYAYGGIGVALPHQKIYITLVDREDLVEHAPHTWVGPLPRRAGAEVGGRGQQMALAPALARARRMAPSKPRSW